MLTHIQQDLHVNDLFSVSADMSEQMQVQFPPAEGGKLHLLKEYLHLSS